MRRQNLGCDGFVLRALILRASACGKRLPRLCFANLSLRAEGEFNSPFFTPALGALAPTLVGKPNTDLEGVERSDGVIAHPYFDIAASGED